MYLYSQLVIIICATQATLLLFHVYYSESIVKKAASYCTLGSCFLVCVVHATYTIAIVQKQLDAYLPNDNQYKFIISFLALFVGLIGYPLFITTFHKGIWFMYLHMVGLVAQFIVASNKKLMPNRTFVLLYTLALLYLTIQTDQYPIANFHEHSPIQIIILVAILAALIWVGWLMLRKTKADENINDMFNLVNEKENESTAPTLSKGGSKSMDKNINLDNIKSDIEL